MCDHRLRLLGTYHRVRRPLTTLTYCSLREMKALAIESTGSTTRSRVDPLHLNADRTTSKALRHVLFERPPRPAAPSSYAPHIVTCDWIALAKQRGCVA